MSRFTIENFPYGKAPFWLLALVLVSTLSVVVTQSSSAANRPELVLATFARNHQDSYQGVARRFEREHGVRVAVELVHSRAPLADVALHDLTDQGVFLAGTLLAIVPPALLFFALEKEFVSGLASGAVKG